VIDQPPKVDDYRRIGHGHPLQFWWQMFTCWLRLKPHVWSEPYRIEFSAFAGDVYWAQDCLNCPKVRCYL